MVTESHQICQTSFISTYVTLCIGQLLLEHLDFQSSSVYTLGKMNNELGWEQGKQGKIRDWDLHKDSTASQKALLAPKSIAFYL